MNSIIPEDTCDYQPCRNSYLDHQLTLGCKLVASHPLSSFLIDPVYHELLQYLLFSQTRCYFSASLCAAVSRSGAIELFVVCYCCCCSSPNPGRRSPSLSFTSFLSSSVVPCSFEFLFLLCRLSVAFFLRCLCL